MKTRQVAYFADIERGDQWDNEGRLPCQLNVYPANVPDSPNRSVERFPYFLAVCERPNAEKERAVAVYWKMPRNRLCSPESPAVQAGILPHRPLFFVQGE
jgi:hypothetical protein